MTLFDFNLSTKKSEGKQIQVNSALQKKRQPLLSVDINMSPTTDSSTTNRRGHKRTASEWTNSDYGVLSMLPFMNFKKWREPISSEKLVFYSNESILDYNQSQRLFSAFLPIFISNTKSFECYRDPDIFSNKVTKYDLDSKDPGADWDTDEEEIHYAQELTLNSLANALSSLKRTSVRK